MQKHIQNIRTLIIRSRGCYKATTKIRRVATRSSNFCELIFYALQFTTAQKKKSLLRIRNFSAYKT